MGQTQTKKVEDLTFQECMDYNPKHTTFDRIVERMIYHIHYPQQITIVDELKSLPKSDLCRLTQLSKQCKKNGEFEAKQMYQILMKEELPVNVLLLIQPWNNEFLEALTEEERTLLKNKISSTGSLIQDIYAIQHKSIEHTKSGKRTRTKRIVLRRSVTK
jgi:hypothetical protein